MTAVMLILATALQRLSMVAISIGGARILGSVEFGRYALAYALCVNVAVVFIDSLSATASVYVARRKNHNEAENVAGTVISISIICALVIAAFLFTASRYLSQLTAHPDLEPIYNVAAFWLLFFVPSGVMSGCLYALGQGKSAAVITGCYASASVIFGLLGAYHFGAIGICGAQALSSAAASLAYAYMLSPNVRSATLSFKEKVPLFEFVLPTAASITLTTPVHLFCLNVLASAPDGLHQTAVFSATFLICAIFTFMPGALTSVIVPHFSRLKTIGGPDLAKSGRLALTMVAAGGALLFATVFITASGIVSVFGNTFAHEEATLRLLAGVGVTSALLVTINQLIWASDRTRINFLISAVYAACYVLFTLYLVQILKLGSAGLAGALLLAQIVQLLLYIVLLKGQGIK